MRTERTFSATDANASDVNEP